MSGLMPRPFDHWTTYAGHGGIDYGQPRGAGVPASGAGVIDFSGYYSERGGWAKFIQYDNGQRHGYYHFDREQGFRKGDRVELGTIFAYVGGTGQYSTGPHLHHEVWNGHSSIIKPPEYWNYVDKNSYVGDGSTAGTDSKPFNPNLPEEIKLMSKSTIFVVVSEDNSVLAIPEGGPAYTYPSMDEYNAARGLAIFLNPKLVAAGIDEISVPPTDVELRANFLMERAQRDRLMQMRGSW